MGSHAAKRSSQVCGRERERAARAQGSAESSGKRTQGTGDPGQKAIPVGSELISSATREDDAQQRDPKGNRGRRGPFRLMSM